MQFCDECGSAMKKQDGAMQCTNCDYTAAQDSTSDFVSTGEQSGNEPIETEEGADFEGKPTATDAICDERGHTKARYIKQTGAADEPPTRFSTARNATAWRIRDRIQG
jgi:DNA-directed RNA polymerase subunit M